MPSSKVILVTGSNAGIGYELVHLLAAKGHTVYLASRKEASGLEAVAKIKKEKNLDVKFVQLDVTDLASVEAAATKINQTEGRLDVLVNNAGIAEFAPDMSVTKPNLAAIRATIDTNLFGLIQTTTAFLPLLRAAAAPAAPAVVLNVSTDMASNTFMASPKGLLHEALAYNTSKAAANAYTVALAHELAAEHIRVNAITPGFTTTKLNGFAPGGKTPEQGALMMVKWCLLDKDGPTGKFAYDSGEWPW
ncbi:hypothetical protein B0H15DRAFT_886667 [Mycena belliarum]|uniref:NAD(P)-binding protein n=1 Tax=Mycena belliarum TaxID=1033014 RepID=A0AAD6U377_9AGAR|nr:hypothetical protein B0H15DRAFT_886667 [Mycena belliae]